MNWHGMGAIYRFEMARAGRTLWQSLVTPVITTALYFVVFGAALGSRMTAMEGVSFGSFNAAFSSGLYSAISARFRGLAVSSAILPRTNATIRNWIIVLMKLPYATTGAPGRWATCSRTTG